MRMLPSAATPARGRLAFTLVELLVVIGIIALLIAILLPSLNSARKQAKSVASLSNLRQLGIGLVMYRGENKGYYPVAAYQSLSDRPRFRWADAIYPYMKNTEVYMSPQLDEAERVRMNKPFYHTTDGVSNPGVLPTTKFFGGYGYNWQYLGNARQTGGPHVPIYWAKDGAQISATAQTVAIADTDGSKNGTQVFTSEGVYVVDPPRMSRDLGSNGSRKASYAPPGTDPGSGNYAYAGGADGDPLYRSTPAERNKGFVNVMFCDGHAESMKLKQLDDFNGDGTPDNGYWNGKADPNRR